MIRIYNYGDPLTDAYDSNHRIFCFRKIILFCFLIFLSIITISLRTMTPVTAATKQSRMRKATQEKHLLVANQNLVQ